MVFNEYNSAAEGDNQPQMDIHNQPIAYRVNNAHDIEEKDLRKHFLFGKGDNPANPTEGKGVGGQSFGQDNLTPSGDDKNNPSQYAGHTNAYLARTEPSEEHPEDSNFTDKSQTGEPDYNRAQPYANATDPKPAPVERGNGENDRPHPQEPYTEGTDDYDGTDGPNIPGPNELPDQQKVGEDNDDDRFTEHIET